MRHRARPGRGGEIVPVPFRNASHPGSEMEVLRLSSIARRAPPGHMERAQRMEFHLVALYLAGKGTHTVDFQPYPCPAGTVIHVQPGQVHRWPAGPGVEAHLVLFTPAFLFPDRPRTGALWQERYFEDVAWPTVFRLSGADRAALEDWYRRLEEVYQAVDGSPASGALLRHLVSVVLLDLARRCSVGQEPVAVASPEFQRLRQFKLDVERSFRVTRRIQDYAQRLRSSPRTLDRTCREALGVSAKRWLDARVVLEARRLLAHTTLSVGAVGEELGFSEPTNFVKFFKARTGQPPGAFRAGLAGSSR